MTMIFTRQNTPSTLVTVLILLIRALIANPLIAQQQTLLVPKSNESEAATQIIHKGFTIKLLRLEQYMQSVQLVFEMKNQDSLPVNNCWFHVSLLGHDHGFLYREQPLLFSELKPFGTQKLELLCESIGVEEVGYIILYPILYEAAREESDFDFPKIHLQVPESITARLLFAHEIE